MSEKGPDERCLAMKVIKKREIPQTATDREHVKAEHYSLTTLSHPFVVKLYVSYQTPSRLFYVMEFLQGGELFTWMEKFQTFSKVSCFNIALISL
jgi:serine/threonine protein kinase